MSLGVNSDAYKVPFIHGIYPYAVINVLADIPPTPKDAQTEMNTKSDMEIPLRYA